MKVFISSVISGFEEFRTAVAEAATSLRHNVIRAEDFGASPGSPQRVCLEGVRRADLVVLVLGERYGEIQPSGMSATHEEFHEAKDRKDILAFVQQGVTPEPKQQSFIKEVQKWSGGRLTGTFRTAADLRDQVTAAIRDFEVSRASGGVDDAELLKAATELLPDPVGPRPTLAIAVAGGPRHQVLRPAKLEDVEFQKGFQSQALVGKLAVLDIEEGTRRRLTDDQFRLEQDSSLVVLTQAGDMAVAVPAVRRSDRHELPALIEEDVVELIVRILRFMSAVLADLDPVHRLGRLSPIAAILDAGYVGWKTREEHRRNPNTSQISMRASDRPVSLQPPGLPRGQFDTAADEIAEDLMVLLRRTYKV